VTQADHTDPGAAATDAYPSATGALASYAAGLTASALPDSVIRQAKAVLIDTAGVLLDGSDGPAVRIALETFPSSGGRCTVVGHGRGAQPDVAAFVNAVAAHSTELDDTHSPSLTHPAAVIVPAVFAASEIAVRCPGTTLLAAVVAGYDVEARLSKAMGPQAQFDRGFHPLSVCGSVGAAVSAGRVLSLSVDEMLACIGLAASQSSGLLSFRADRSHMNKAFQAGIAARNGLYAAMLARRGFRAAPNALDAPGEPGMLGSFGNPEPAVGELSDGLGERYEICGTTFKRHPSCGRSHAPIDSLLMLRSAHDIRWEDIEEIAVEVAHSTVPAINARPQLSHNIQHLLAVVAIEGTLGREHLRPEWASRPDVADLTKKVKLSGSDDLQRIFPAHKAASVTVRTASGVYTERLAGPLGNPERPLSAADLRTKFLTLASERQGEAAAAATYAQLAALETAESVMPLLDRLGRP
jgi:2-methylcitrate dehydratase PrpD